MNYLDIPPGHLTRLPSRDDLPELVHEFEDDQIRAVNAALAAGRPLLVRGEPGIGKSQLARAVAHELHRAFISQVVDSRTESRDLLWHFDAVARLADAQILGCRTLSADSGNIPPQVQGKFLLPVADYLQPRALWWAFNWQDAEDRAKNAKLKTPEQPAQWSKEKGGCVVLIDEIDKAESDVPNGLLEALGSSSFHPQGLDRPVVVSGAAPLVVITTNEERTLPDAFVRRCLVLHLKLPRDPAKLVELLVQRGRAHFDGQTTESVLSKAAECLAEDRALAVTHHWHPLPGQAEYLDLLRAVIKQREGDHAEQEKLMDDIRSFVLRKHPDAAKEKPEAKP